MKFTCALLLTALVLFLVSPAELSAAELHFSLAGDPQTFDALKVSDQRSELIRYLTGGALVRINRVTDKPEPALAQSWKLSDGGRTITFRLRAGLRFSDGSPLTADDVARTFSAALDPKHEAPVGDTFRSQQGDPQVRVISPLEIAIHYPQPKPDIDRLFDSLSIVPATAAPLPASAGPFFVAEYKPGDFVRLARNPNYWKRDAAGKQLPYLDSIRIDIQPNREIELTRFLRGELHLINKLDPENFDRIIKDKPAAARDLGASLDSEILFFNQAPSPSVPVWKHQWFTSAIFRRAVSASIHRDDIARVVFRGHAHPAAGPVSSSNRFWFDAGLKSPPPDPQAAVRDLAKEGFTLRDNVLRDREGHPVEFSLLTTSGSRPREAMAAMVQDDLRKIGVHVNIVTLDSRSLIDRLSNTPKFEACLFGFANVSVDPVQEMNIWLSSRPQHPWWPSEKSPATPWEARVDKLELLQASEPSRAARKKAFDEFQRIVVEQAPILYLVNPDYLVGISTSLKGLQASTSPPQLLWNIDSLSLE